MTAHSHPSGSPDAGLHGGAHSHAGHGAGPHGGNIPRLIAWEMTRRCLLACKHCRASATCGPVPNELTTKECFDILANIAAFAKPILILTGGEPMLRPDVYEIAAEATRLGLPVVMSPCGPMLNDETVARILKSGIRKISISIDAATAASHDAFRGVPGAFDAAIRGIEAAKRGGLAFQINTTVTQHNIGELEAILELAKGLGADVFNPFLLVPTGRGKNLLEQELSAVQYEEALNWLADQQGRKDIEIRVTCAPHYQRVIRQRGLAIGPRAAKGCMGGQQFAFISHRGRVQICGFLDIECGDLRRETYDFRKIWETSPVFLQMRNKAAYGGRCGRCEFHNVCGGCRARARGVTGDYMAEEPFCTYQPKMLRTGEGNTPKQTAPATAGRLGGGTVDEFDALDRKILDIVQTAFPVSSRPFEEIASRVGCSARQALERVGRMHSAGAIRRIGAVFDTRALGYVSTLVACKVEPARLAEVAAAVSALPGVTHNYSRKGDYNLWFTLVAPSQASLDEQLRSLAAHARVELHSLPALKVYKIRVDFQLGDSDKPAQVQAVQAHAAAAGALSDGQIELVRMLQDDLPLVEQPYAAVAQRLGWREDQVLEQVRAWLAQGVIRRLGAVVRHQKLGFVANGMAVFEVPAERVDAAGALLAQRREISHCYRRPPLDDFAFSLYAMIHGRERQEVCDLAAQLATQIGAARHDVLFSEIEFKKTSVKYFVE